MPSASIRPEPCAGHPFLDFLNTVSDDGKSRRENSFTNAAGLCCTLESAGFPVPLSPLTAGDMDQILGLRETAYGVLSALAAQRSPAEDTAQALAATLRSVYARAELTMTQGGLHITAGAPDHLYDHLVLSLDGLLRSNEFTRLRECRRCTHLFLDKGRGIGRRWCSMARCGNRAKAENFRARQRRAA